MHEQRRRNCFRCQTTAMAGRVGESRTRRVAEGLGRTYRQGRLSLPAEARDRTGTRSSFRPRSTARPASTSVPGFPTPRCFPIRHGVGWWRGRCGQRKRPSGSTSNQPANYPCGRPSPTMSTRGRQWSPRPSGRTAQRLMAAEGRQHASPPTHPWRHNNAICQAADDSANGGDTRSHHADWHGLLGI